MRLLVCTNLDWEKLIFVWTNKTSVSWPWCQSPTLGCLIPESPCNPRHQEDLGPGLTSRASCPFWGNPAALLFSVPHCRACLGCGLPGPSLPSPDCPGGGGAAGGHTGEQGSLRVRLWGRLDPTLGGLCTILLCCAAPPMVYSHKIHSSVPCLFSKTLVCPHNTGCNSFSSETGHSTPDFMRLSQWNEGF